MDDSWHQTNRIVMAVQTAEIRQEGVDSAPEIHLSCSLVTIARGQCQLELQANDKVAGGEIGSLTIEVNRPMMRGRANLPSGLFDAISRRLAASPRPVSLTLTLTHSLRSVSRNADRCRNDDRHSGHSCHATTQITDFWIGKGFGLSADKPLRHVSCGLHQAA